MNVRGDTYDRNATMRYVAPMKVDVLAAKHNVP